jgi:DNA-binding IclR family transcriptional regulator
MSLHHPLNRLRLEAREQLRLLRERHDENICLIVFVGYQRVIIDFIPGREPLNPLYETWLSNPLHASAAGIILLSGLSDEERRRLLGEEPFPAPTGNTVTTYSALQKEFDVLEVNGYAIARETTFVGVNAVAAPIRGPQRLIGCLAFTGSAHALGESRLASLGESLKDAANLISWGAPSIKAVMDFLGDSIPDNEFHLSQQGRG